MMKASDVLSSCWKIVREDNLGHAMIELEGKFYIVYVDGKSYQFQSAIPADAEIHGGTWVAPWTEAGLMYVASGRSRAAANAQWRRHIIPIEEHENELRSMEDKYYAH